MAEEKPEHHKVPVVKINEVLTHPNADKLDIIPVGGYQAISAKGQFKAGDLAYYIYPDSVVPEREEYSFLWRDRVVPGEPIPPRYRRITARRLRKEWSEGLLMPLRPINTGFNTEWCISDGDGTWKPVDLDQDISDLLGIEHYNPPDPEQFGGSNESGPKSGLPKSFKGWVYYIWYRILNSLGFDSPLRGVTEKGPKTDKPYYDIENFKNYKNVFEPGESVVVTEKLHGCQGKFVFQNGKMYVGSRRLWKSQKSKCIWRRCLEQNPWIEEWCRSNEGYTLYGEVIPCQGEKFMYGYKQGEVGFKVFDILTPEHLWLAWEQLTSANPVLAPNAWVPQLYQGLYDEERIRALVDGKSTLGGGIREGIVIKPFTERHVRGLGRATLKLVSNAYLEKA